MPPDNETPQGPLQQTVAPTPPPLPPVQPPAAQAPVPSTRNKITALVLAIFLGVFAWIYTYAKDKKKFWTTLATSLVLLVIAYSSDALALFFIYYIYAFGIYIWVIVDTVKKPDAYFTQYPNYRPGDPGSAQVQAQQPVPAQPSDDDAYQTLMPTKNKFALKSYYYGCIGILPLAGLPFSVLAITNGREALRQYKANPTPGARGHAKVGIGLGIVELVFFALILIALADFIIR